MRPDDPEVYRRSLDNLRTNLTSILHRLDRAGVESADLLPEFVAEGLGRAAGGIAGTITFINTVLPPSPVDEGNPDR